MGNPGGRSGRAEAAGLLRLLLAATLVAVAGCRSGAPPAGPPPAARLTLAPKADFQLPGWTEDTVDDALPAFLKSCAVLAEKAADADLGIAGRAADWTAVCRAAGDVPPDDPREARRFFEDSFVPFAAGADGRPDGLFTGYYEPTLRGSRRRTSRYRYALYRAPPELGRQPLPTRAQIEAGALRGRGLELVWVDDAIDAFFLHIQGSGRVVLPNGEVMRVGYAGQNGHPYFAIGRDLVQRGIYTPETISMQAIRAWLSANPEEAPILMARNTSFVFFRELEETGPVGAQGVVLTPGRSLAVDRGFVPFGVPIWLDAEWPGDPNRRIRRLVIAQDTGGAIKGPVRGDLFWGEGRDAAELAGIMKSRGRYYLLLPRTVLARRPLTG